MKKPTAKKSAQPPVVKKRAMPSAEASNAKMPKMTNMSSLMKPAKGQKKKLGQ